jgi:Flp pilus assembly protein TadG
MSLFACLKRMLSSRRGNVALIFALASPLVIGSAALSVETTYWYFKQHQLQAAADDAAFAAGQELRNGSPQAVVNTAALNAATQNGYNNSIGTITVQTPPSTGPYAGNSSAVSVILTETQQRFFTQLFSKTPVVETTSATADYQTVSDACVLALNQSATNGVYISGDAQLTTTGCVVMSNAFSSGSVDVWGNSSLTASCVISAGGVQSKGGIDDASCSQPVTNAPPAADPFASLPAPPVSSTCASSSGSALQPGTYCGGLSLQGGNTTLAPGVYVINGGSLTINGNATLSGSGVTFYLTGGATVSMNGNPAINLSAPTSGTYSGILFYGDRNYPGLSESFNGNASSSMTGTIYFPTDNITYNGDFSGVNGCTYIVGGTVSWSGNAGLSLNCTGAGMTPIPALTTVKLVG